jgi:plastocyanin
MAPGATFGFTFTEAGQYPYFCLSTASKHGTAITHYYYDDDNKI